MCHTDTLSTNFQHSAVQVEGSQTNSDIRDAMEINTRSAESVSAECCPFIFWPDACNPLLHLIFIVDQLQIAGNVTAAFGAGAVGAWTPALSQIFPDASAVRPHGANRLTMVFGPVLEAGSPSLSAFVWKGLACYKPLTLTASSAALLSHGAPGSPGSADSSPGSMFTAALHPHPVTSGKGLGWGGGSCWLHPDNEPAESGAM